jgi:adenylylsulfate kinase
MYTKEQKKEIHEKRFNQKAVCIWFTGLSGAGKSTLAVALQEKLIDLGFITQYLDGDLLRNTLNSNLGFSEEDRLENIRRVAEVTKLFLEAGVICINAFISPTNQIRNLAKSIIGEDNFIEIYLNTSLEICERRDPKGLYAKVRKGEIKNFTGVDAVFEKPQNSNLILDTGKIQIENAVENIFSFILPRIRTAY